MSFFFSAAIDATFFSSPTFLSHLSFSNAQRLRLTPAPAAAAAAAAAAAPAAQPSSRPPPLSAAAAARAAAASSDDPKGKGPARPLPRGPGFPGSAAGNSAGGASNVRSLADVRRAQQEAARNDGSGSDSDGDDDDGANEYYVGGDKSGQVVKGHPKDKKKREGAGVPSDPRALFDAARAAGAHDGTAEDLPGGGEAPGGSGGGGAFAGAGRTLAGGAPAADAAPPAGGEEAGGGSADAAPPAPKPVSHVIAFYDNGVFTVDDGPAREMRDPANAEFLDAISAGRCPAELEPAPSSAGEPVPVSVNLVRKAGDYVKPAYVAFGGQGRTLAGGGGGGGGEDKGKEPAGASAAAAPSAAAAASAASPSASGGTVTWQGVDESKPSTSLQLRLRDGSRLVARFNLCHTVADIKRFLSAAKPGGGGVSGGNYSLSSMGFPPKKLEDDSATIEDAGLANAVVVQK